MITRTVKIPEELVSEIDKHIEGREYSTRADFILHALRETVHGYAELKKGMMDEYGGVVPDTLVAESFRGRTNGCLQWMELHKGKLIQINTRVPEGLENKIEILLKPEYGFRKKSDFTRVAVAYLLMALGEIDGVFNDEERFAARQKEVSEIMNRVLEEGMSNGMSMDSIIKEVQRALDEKGYH